MRRRRRRRRHCFDDFDFDERGKIIFDRQGKFWKMSIFLRF